MFILDRRAGHERESGLAHYLEVGSPNGVTMAPVAVAGLTLLLKPGGGLYWLIPAFIASLVGGVANAWLFLLKLPG
jgi:hypothetical protein